MIGRLAVVFALSSFGTGTAWACSCTPITVPSSWFNNTDAMVVDVIGTQLSGDTRFFGARVVKTLKGCTSAAQVVALQTAANEAACGIQLDVGTRYLVFGDQVPDVQGVSSFAVDLCDANMRASDVGPNQRAFLEKREVFCPDSGAHFCVDGSEPVQCLIDPCENAPGCAGPDGTCVSNYCNGCGYEEYDAFGYLVCWGP